MMIMSCLHPIKWGVFELVLTYVFLVASGVNSCYRSSLRVGFEFVVIVSFAPFARDGCIGIE
jgi:hypothetical protein